MGSELIIGTALRFGEVVKFCFNGSFDREIRFCISLKGVKQYLVLLDSDL